MKSILKTLLIGVVGSLLSSCSSGPSLTDMLADNDFAAANEYISETYTAKKLAGMSSSEKADKYIPEAIQVLKAEASYLMDENDAEAERLFMLLINDVSGNIGNQQFQVGHLGRESMDDKYEADDYNEEITPYNAGLLPIIKEAIIKDNPEFAKKVLSMMEKNYTVVEKFPEEGEYSLDITEDNSWIEEAQKFISDYEASH
jgi:hypothetical protein